MLLPRVGGRTPPSAPSRRTSAGDSRDRREAPCALTGRSVAALVVALLLLAGCSSAGSTVPAPRRPPTVRFASYDFSENQILVEVYAEGVRRAGLPVTVQSRRRLPGRWSSPHSSRASWTSSSTTSGRRSSFAQPDDGRAGTAAAARCTPCCSPHAGRPRGVTVLDPARPQDQNGFAVDHRLRRRARVDRLSDLGRLRRTADLRRARRSARTDRSACPGSAARLRRCTSRQVRSHAVAGGDGRGAARPADRRRDARDDRCPPRRWPRSCCCADDRALQPHENVVPLVRTARSSRWGTRLRHGARRGERTADHRPISSG